MFTECFRCTASLEQLLSKLFYNNQVVSRLGTALSDRPHSQKTINFLWSKFCYENSISHIIFDLCHRICMTIIKIKSKHNFYNIFQALTLIKKLISHEIFKPSKIIIETPYQKQNDCYRAAMTKALGSTL